MRVVHVVRYFHPHTGGTEQVVASLARELSALGVDSQVVVADLDRTGAGPAPAVPLLEVPVVGSARFPIPTGRLGEVVRVLRDADIVHLHDVRFLFELTALVRRRPVVLTTHGLTFHTDAHAGLKRLAWRAWIAPRLRRLDRVVAVSARDAAACRDVGVRGVTTIHNGVDVEGFSAAPDRPRRDVRSLLYFGRVAPEKNVDALSGVLAARPAWRLTVAGAVDARHDRVLDRAFARVADRVERTGPVSAERLTALLDAADCVVLPATGESFGLTLVESLSAGVPVVAADAPAAREIGGAAGVGFTSFADGERAAAAIEATVRRWDPVPARARAAEFSWSSTAAAYRKVYDEVTSS